MKVQVELHSGISGDEPYTFQADVDKWDYVSHIQVADKIYTYKYDPSSRDIVKFYHYPEGTVIKVNTLDELQSL